MTFQRSGRSQAAQGKGLKLSATVGWLPIEGLHLQVRSSYLLKSAYRAIAYEIKALATQINISNKNRGTTTFCGRSLQEPAEDFAQG